MHFAFRKAVPLFAISILMSLCWSCEKHQLGEMPTAQKEHVDLATGANEDSDVVKERSAVPEPSANATPAEFFPSPTPR
jgi:hypothetical protein